MRHPLLSAVAALLAVAGLHAPADAAQLREYDRAAFIRAQESGQRIMVVIASRWRPSSQQQEPVIRSISEDFMFADTTIFQVDFDRRKDALQELKVDHDATVIVFRGKQERGRLTGASDEMQLRRLLNAAR